MKKFLGIALLAAFGSATFANNTSDEDVLFNLLKQEVNYYYSHLSKDSVPVNLVTLNALQEKGVTIQSDMGYATVNETNWRRLSPILRIGKEESYRGRSGSYNGNQNDLPLTNDTTVIKDVIWNALCDKYNAMKSDQKSSKDEEEEDTAQCPITIEHEKYYEAPLPEYRIDREKWKALLNRITLIKKDGIKATCKANISYTDQRKYIVKSDGTGVVCNYRTFWLSLYATVEDKKGIECPMFKNFFAYNESDLPDENTLRETMINIIERADALSKAPMAEAYSGPVLFSGDAGGVFFHEVLGHRLEKDDSEFKPMMGKNVLSSEISVTCDPTLKELNGTPLDGYYLYDDEGTKAQRVECIKDGVMKDFLHVLPQKKKDAPSNGHGRAAFGNKPIPRQSNLLVETSKPYTEEQLRKMFVQQLKESGKEFGFYIHTVSNGWTTSGDTRRVSSFNVVPVETYKIYADGRPDSLVRGVSFIGTPLSAFSNIKAAGGKIETQNGRCGAQSGWVPVSITAPMIYVSQMETQCVKKEKNKKPVLAEPEFLPKDQLSGMPADSIIFRAMEDEMNRSMDSLKQKDGTRPYFLDYNVYRTGSAHVRSSLGSCEVFTMDDIKNTGKVYAVVGDAMKMDMNDSWINTMPDEVSYNHLRKELWGSTFYAFNKAYKDYKSRTKWRGQEFLDDSIPEWPKMPAGNFVCESALSNYQKDAEALKLLVDTLSTVFKDYPELCDTRISGRLEYVDAYRVTSDGLRLRTPVKKVRIYGNANFITTDGKVFSDGPQFQYCGVDDLPPTDSLIAWIKDFASELIDRKNIKMSEDEEYIGPILFEDKRACSVLYANGFAETTIYNYIRCHLDLRNKKYDSTYKLLGKKVVSKDISVWQLGNDSVFNGHRLYGYRKYDADGIRPATVELIRNGILVNQLAGRKPSPNALKSTGNEWMSSSVEYGEPFSSHAVHRISFDNAMSRKKLVKKLISMAKEQHLEYAYILGDKGVLRVDTKTGKEERVRLYVWGTPSRLQLMDNVWASKEETADYITSVIHPKSILFPLLEMKVGAIDSKKCERFVELRH